VSTSAVALAYVLEQPFPAVALIGPRDTSELDSSLDALRLPMDAGTLAWLATGTDEATAVDQVS
jgi:aryl-alcohol dehydrogenase-like predicted oxidoreductase